MSSRSRSITKKSHVRSSARRTWSVHEKLIVVHYFERIQNVRATTKRFDIEPKQ
ncbi:39421_t:CDS:1, partial [Gigaspora margarita]